MDQFNDYLASSEGFINHHNLMFQHSADLEASLLESFAEEVLDLTHDTSAAPQDNSIMCFPPFNSSLSLPTFDDSHSAFFVEPFQQVVVGAGIPNDFQMPSSSFPFTHQPFQPLYHHQQTHHQQYQEQSLGFNSVSPSPSLESPYSSLHGYSSSTPPHTPTCLPLSIVAPSSTSMFYLDTHCLRSSPAPLESTTTTSVQPVKITIPSTRSMHFSPLPTPVQRSPLSSFISTNQLLATEKRAASPFEELSPCSESVEPASPSASLPEISLPSTTTTTTTTTRKPKQSKSASTHSDSVYSPRKSSTTSKRSSTQQSSSNAAAGSTMGVKKRHILKERETKMLNEVFESTRFLQASQAAELAAKMGMTVTQIRIWFQNKRAFVKRQSS
ncbi:hypothetical protein HDU77_006789, partial [Chytriomyces hyalinus]